MLEFFASAYFLGILLMAGGCILFLVTFFPSWYGGHLRRFWLTRLTYKDDKDQQSFVRFMWILAWLLSVIGSLVVAYNHPNVQHSFGSVLIQMLYYIVVIWLIAKAIMACFICVQHVIQAIIRIKEWIFNDKPLFRKHQKIRPYKQ